MNCKIPSLIPLSLALLLALVELPVRAEPVVNYSAVQTGTLNLSRANGKTSTAYAGLRWGGGFSRYLSAEIEGLGTLNSGEPAKTNGYKAAQVLSTAVYLAHRIRLTPLWYTKARIGAAYNRFIFYPDSGQSSTANGIGGSGGIGIGLQTSVVSVELELTRLEEDILLYGLAASFNF